MGKRIGVFLLVLALSLSVDGRAYPQAVPSAKEPVYLYLQAGLTDHINIEITEDRLRRLLPEIEKLRQKHADAHVSVLLLFSGASSDALAQRNAQTHIVDFVKGYIQRGVVEAGYDGSDEPTYETRPMVEFKDGDNIEDHWLVRQRAAESLLLEGRNPVTGAVVPGKAGGLKRMQEVFGTAACIRGVAPRMRLLNGVKTGPGATPTRFPIPSIVPELGGDSEILAVIRRYNSSAVMFGLAEDNPADLPGYGGGLEGFGKLVSATPESAPEIYWQDNVLRTSESSNPSEANEDKEHGYKGLDDLKDDLKELKRATVHVTHIELADERYYLKPKFTKDDDYALSYAYKHPDSPKLPADQLLSAQGVDAYYAKEEAALAWLANEWIPANAGSRFVSNADLKSMTAPSTGFGVSTEALRADLSDVLKKWGNNTYPPPFVHSDGHYLSLADLYQVLTDELGQRGRTGKFPERVQVVAVYGPLYTLSGHGPNIGDVSASAIDQYCAKLMDTLHDTSTSGPIPHNMVPNEVKIGDVAMNSAQFLRLMATAFVDATPDEKLRVRMTYMFPGQAMLMPKTRVMSEMGAMWTVKPAPLSGAAADTK